ncbi:hypothetical protein JW321_13395 [Pseudomonas syringae pv. papulans]|uniref:Uncharacterized protein n=2 Tax=Pseudomonas TaxID=286 RepID=A0AA43IYY3_PSESX|nr:hypothetical protein [Pseudomonas syringae pv. papulans]MDH4625550.1 hypothetical protein [Pseudomonas syringae pv. papulans]
MLGKAPSPGDGFAGVSFWILYLCAVFCLLCGAYYFRSSWQLRDFDRGLPTLVDLEIYRADATAHFAEHGENTDDAATYYKAIILSYYIEGATVNAVNNDKRGSQLVSLANCVTLTMILSVLSFIPFYTHQQELNQHEQSKAATAAATPNALR